MVPSFGNLPSQRAERRPAHLIVPSSIGSSIRIYLNGLQKMDLQQAIRKDDVGARFVLESSIPEDTVYEITLD